MSVNAEKLVTFGPVRFFVRYADFCHLVPEVIETSVVG